MTFKKWLRTIEKEFIKYGFSAEYANSTAYIYKSHYEDKNNFIEPLEIVKKFIEQYFSDIQKPKRRKRT